MNRYGRQAMEYWQNRLPGRYAQIPDPQEYFTTLGQQVAEQIAELSALMAAEEPAGDGYLDEVGRLNQIRQRAQERVLPEMVFPAPEAGSPQDGAPVTS